MSTVPDYARAVAICVDDFGLHEGIDAAVLELAQMGRVQAVSCMVGGTSWHRSVTQLATLPRGRVDVGLHLDLTEHPLVLPARPLSRVIASSLARQMNAHDLRAEIRSQLDAFDHAVGRPPDHVDGHQHVHQLPQVRELLVEELLVRYLRHRPWLRSTRRPARGAPVGWFKPWLIEALGGPAMEHLAQTHGYAMNAHLLGIYDFSGDAQHYLTLLRAWFACAQPRDLLMCHAARPTPDVRDPILQARITEFEVLQGEAFSRLLDEAAIRLAPLSAQAASL